MTAVAVGTTSDACLTAGAATATPEYVYRERHQTSGGTRRVSDVSPPIPFVAAEAERARYFGRESRGGSQIACTPTDRRRKTVPGCDDWGDEASALCGTKRHTLRREPGCWDADLPGEAAVHRPVGLPNDSRAGRVRRTYGRRRTARSTIVGAQRPSLVGRTILIARKSPMQTTCHTGSRTPVILRPGGPRRSLSSPPRWPPATTLLIQQHRPARQRCHRDPVYAKKATDVGPPTINATGLNNPRGIKFGPDGYLYVAEGGVGGANSTVGQCPQVPAVGPYLGSDNGSRISKIPPGGVAPITVAESSVEPDEPPHAARERRCRCRVH